MKSKEMRKQGEKHMEATITLTPLDYARIACDTMMRKYAAVDLPPKGHFHYHQGVFLSGVLKTWQLTGNPAYLQYAADWVDSVFTAEYARRFDKPELMEEIVQEILLMWEHTRDEKTGLWYHAWDESRQAAWCNPETGLAPEFWGRSIGWVPVGIQDAMAQMEPEQADYQKLAVVAKDLLESVLKYQSEDGRWYQVVNKGGMEGNWLENSCSCLFAAGHARVARIGLMGKEAFEAAQRAFDGVVKSLEWDGRICWLIMSALVQELAITVFIVRGHAVSMIYTVWARFC